MACSIYTTTALLQSGGVITVIGWSVMLHAVVADHASEPQCMKNQQPWEVDEGNVVCI